MQGVKEKYGNLIGEDKGKSFFDKIIQVPFKMPVTHYKIDKFIVEMFKQVNIDLSADESTNVYVNLIQSSVGCNPRTMKRLFNAYLLLTYISKNVELNISLDDSEQGIWYKKILFGILCCQYAYEDLYNFMVINNKEFSESDLLKDMCNADTYRRKKADGETDEEKQEYAILTDSFKGKSEDEIRKMAHFMELFFKVIDRNEDKDLGTDELWSFVELLNLTTITSAGNEEVGSEDSIQKDYRRVPKPLCYSVLNQ